MVWLVKNVFYLLKVFHRECKIRTGHSVNETIKYAFNSKLVRNRIVLTLTNPVILDLLDSDGVRRLTFLGAFSGFVPLSLCTREF